MKKTSRAETGKRGEQIAKQYLQDQGYAIVDQNWHCLAGEIDLIIQDKSTLVFVEVRTRHAPSTEMAFASITHQKRQRLINSAYAYLEAQALTPDTLWRIDVVGVALAPDATHIDHVEDALGW